MRSPPVWASPFFVQVAACPSARNSLEIPDRNALPWYPHGALCRGDEQRCASFPAALVEIPAFRNLYVNGSVANFVAQCQAVENPVQRARRRLNRNLAEELSWTAPPASAAPCRLHW